MFTHFWVSDHARHLRFLQLEAEKSVVLQWCIEAISQLSADFEVETSDLSGGEIVAKSKATWNVAASLVVIHLAELERGTIEVDIVSGPADERVLKDFGVNKKNLDSISRFLLKQVRPLGNYSIVTATNPWNVSLALSFDDAFNECLKAIGQWGDRIKFEDEDREGGLLLAKTRANPQTWGETIKFAISEADGELTNLTLESKSTWFLPLEDWGRNMENIKDICRALRRYVVDQY